MEKEKYIKAANILFKCRINKKKLDKLPIDCIPKNIEDVVVKKDTHNKITNYLVNNAATKETELYCSLRSHGSKTTNFVEKFKQRFTDGLTTMNNGLTKKAGLKIC